MLAWRIRTLVNGGFGTAPNVFAHAAIDFILGGMTLRHAFSLFFDVARQTKSLGLRLQRRHHTYPYCPFSGMAAFSVNTRLVKTLM